MINSQMLLAVIKNYLTLKDKIALTMASKKHYDYVSKHGLNYIIYDLVLKRFYRNGTECRDIDGLAITVINFDATRDRLQPLGEMMEGVTV